MTDNTNPLTDTPGPEKRARSAQATSARSKTDVKFWQRRIFKPVYARADGTRVQAANYAVEISFRGRRIKWSLETPNKEAAAARAKEIYLFSALGCGRMGLKRFGRCTLCAKSSAL